MQRCTNQNITGTVWQTNRFGDAAESFVDAGF
jgi:hypothetical protein